MATYNFKSSGTTTSRQNSTILKVTPTPIGILTPMQLGSTQGQGLLVQTFSMADQVGDNLRNLLLTNWGERLFQYNFGANLRPLTTEYTNIDDFDSKAFDNIKNAVSTWMPYIDLDGYQSNVNRINNTNTAIIAITITYDVPSLQVKGAQVTITLYVI